MALANANLWMQRALDAAAQAAAVNEVPIGAIVVKDNQLVSSGFNQRESTKDPTCHAEILAIRQAAHELGDWRLEGCELYVTLEPCLMCYAASCQTRIGQLIYGCENEKNPELLRDIYHRWPNGPQVTGGVLVESCRQLLSNFFKELRK